MTRVLLAPDKFKGSLTAAEVAGALHRGITGVGGQIHVRPLPVADGGEGTLASAVAAGFERVPVTATGPIGNTVTTAYARRGETAVVELADVSGIARLPGGRLRPLQATSRGTGQVMRAAIDHGCRRIVLGIGGSACTDGGAGMVQALGGRLRDADGREIEPGGRALADLAHLEVDAVTGLLDVELVVACDVDNPLIGAQGAAAVYGPQKGASDEDVALLDAALTHWADRVTEHTGRDDRWVPGAGAAGGVGYAAVALLGAQLRPGIDLLLDLIGFDDAVADADWVVVGEGSLDEQSLRGKAPVGVARRARRAGARVLAVSGRCTLSPDRLGTEGIERAYTLADLEPDPDLCMREAAKLVETLGARLAEEHALGAS
jgi:glycerate kinase